MAKVQHSNTIKQREIEHKWIEALKTMQPYRINIKLVGKSLAFTVTYIAIITGISAR